MFIVRKYGGSSLARSRQLRAIAAELAAAQAQGVHQVVVVSAMGQATDGWLRRAHALSATPPPRELDMLVSVGERTTSALLCIAIAAAGGRATSLTGSQAGVLTDHHHQQATIQEVRCERVRALVDHGEIVVVAGYQGVSAGREVTTLGRGGSDTTAVALAATLRPDACVLYSDVDGIYDGDPRVVPQARLLKRVGWGLLAAMSRAGAAVVAPEAAAWAARTRTEVWACRSHARAGAADSLPRHGTLICADEAAPPGQRAVVGNANIIRLAGAATGGGALTQALADLRVDVLAAAPGQCWLAVGAPEDPRRRAVQALAAAHQLRATGAAVVTALGDLGQGAADRLGLGPALPWAALGLCWAVPPAALAASVRGAHGRLGAAPGVAGAGLGGDAGGQGPAG